ncbi:MAG: lipid A deacylase LpxR family protein [Hyphomonadaceae bacterium]|nr:lipid A deacylase LpxR family protein [Hyphomonadaceae bacterium]
MSTSVTVASSETPTIPWRDVYTLENPKDIFLETDWSGAEALRSIQGSRDAARLIQPSVGKKDFSAAFAFAATGEQTGFGFDLNLVPSVSYQEEGKFETRRVGAEVRLGWDFDQRGSNAVADSWYIFAGTEDEALVWEAGEHGLANVTNAMALRDQVTVGDIQAGVSVQRGGGQLSFSYIRREVHWGDRNGSASENEDFAGISFTLKR